MTRNRIFQFICVVLFLAVVSAGWFAFCGAAETKTKEYEIAVEPYKSDTVRLIEAYERLSEQYLTLVQQNLAMMAAADRQILDRLDKIEAKIDALAAKAAPAAADTQTKTAK